MTGSTRDPRSIERGDLFFTAAPGATADLPLPFRIAGRLPRLVDAPSPVVAILGFGLGAVGALMLEERPGLHLDAVEPDPSLLAAVPAALRHRVVLRGTDALSHLRRARRRYHLIFDDCFVLDGDDARRPPELIRHAELIAGRLAPAGIYVRNLLPTDELSVEDQCEDLRRSFDHVALRAFREWDNVFALASRSALPTDWRARLR